MIISRTPFRISFMGGGTDLPAFYEQEEGMVVSTSIDKYVYITVNNRFDSTYRLSYSKTEICQEISQIEHPILRVVLQKHAPNKKGLEIISMADIPSGTGLGSSSSFTVGTLHALKAHLGQVQTASDLAAEASRVEIEDLQEPIGKQDQYAAAFGGLNSIRFFPDGKVQCDPVICSPETYRSLEQHTVLYFTGFTRSASGILAEQKKKTSVNRDLLRKMKTGAEEFRKVLESNGSISDLGKILDDGWKLKKQVASASSSQIDDWYAKGLKAGAYGGKILGAGGGGFLMFLCPPDKQSALSTALGELRPFPVQFERGGSRIIFVS